MKPLIYLINPLQLPHIKIGSAQIFEDIAATPRKMNLDNYYQLFIDIDLRSKLLTNLGDSSLINMLGLVPATSFSLLNNGFM
jgi:hypothetical protein